VLAVLAGTPAVAQPPHRPAGNGDRVMYFHKPADALAADGLPDAGLVAMAPKVDPPAAAAGLPDVSTPPVGIPQPPAPPTRAVVTDRPIPEAGRLPELPPLPVGPRDGLPHSPVQSAPKKLPDAKPADAGQGVTDIPAWSAISQMYDDATLQKMILDSITQRLSKEGRAPTLPPFPELQPLVPPGTPYVARTVKLPPGRGIYEPAFVIHRRLHFEEKNSERQGWDLGFFQPFVSTASFYKNALLWPNSLVSGLEVGFWDTSAGKCLPGTPTPYYLYPPGLTVSGMMAEAAAFTGGTFILHPWHAGNVLGPFIH
jgi:hypothetical protein